DVTAPREQVSARLREVRNVVELTVPFELSRDAIDSVERGARDADWQPAKDAAQRLAFAEDGAIFDGYLAADIVGIREGTSNRKLTLPTDVSA
ncbi:family 1 encapsulin nanocompartment shell protein, partial [Cupriavidus sp. SIMBA_020]